MTVGGISPIKDIRAHVINFNPSRTNATNSTNIAPSATTVIPLHFGSQNISHILIGDSAGNLISPKFGKQVEITADNGRERIQARKKIQDLLKNQKSFTIQNHSVLSQKLKMKSQNHH